MSANDKARDVEQTEVQARVMAETTEQEHRMMQAGVIVYRPDKNDRKVINRIIRLAGIARSVANTTMGTRRMGTQRGNSGRNHSVVRADFDLVGAEQVILADLMRTYLNPADLPEEVQ